MIGYLSVKKIDEKHVGGLLVVDESGIPHEFKYTDPIIPNQLQKILYGKSLETYLHVEIISKSLLKKSKINQISYLQITQFSLKAERMYSSRPHSSHLQMRQNRLQKNV